MGSENFCLKWNDHHSVFFSNMESLCEKSFLTDVVLSAGGQMYPAHKLVLCICSTYFQELFFKTQNPAMQFNNTIIYLKDVDPIHLQLLLSYMYRGEVDVSENLLTDFLKTASGLRVRGLTGTDTRNTPAPDASGLKRKLTHPPAATDYKRREIDYETVAKQDEIVIDENPITSEIKEERDEPSSTWNSVQNGENIQNAQNLEYTLLAMSNTQADMAAFDDEKDQYPTKTDRFEEDSGVSSDKLKAYQCEMCSMSFNQKWLLRRHWKTHTGAKPYKCTVCSRTFSLRDSCTRHIKTVHRDLVDLTRDNVNTLVDVTDPDFEPNNVMAVQYNE